MSTTTTTTTSTVATPTAIPIKTTTPSHSHYKTLNLPPTASPSDIRTAFHHFCKLAQQPGGGPNHIPIFTSSQRFKDLKEAYDTLSDAESRKKYDIGLAKEGDREMGERLTREMEGKGGRGEKGERGGREVYEGRGEERVVKWTGRPRGPRVRGTNV